MKTIKYFNLIFLAAVMLASCKATVIAPAGVSAINIVNASTDVPSVSVSFAIPATPYYKQQAVVGYGSAAQYGEEAGALPLTLVSSADTSGHIYQNTLTVTKGVIYSLYIYGSLPTVSTMLLQDNIPVHKDSVSGARFVNLSPDAGSINISLQGNTGNEFSALAYKSLTAFKSYSNTSSVMNNGGYNFNVTNASGTVLATFNWNPQIFQNNTLVFSGTSAAGYEVFQVNNY